MPIPRSLYALQLLDTQLAQLRRERLHLDDGTALRDQASALQKEIDAAQESLQRSTLARNAKEGELKQREEKLRTQQARLMNAKSAHEVASLQRDIAGITKSRGELDEAILLAMDECEICASKLDDLRQQFSAVSAQLSEVETQFSQDAARLDGELTRVLAERQAAFSPLGDDEKTNYDQCAKKHGGVALTWNEGGNCHACGMTLTPYNLKAAKSEEWPTCESCGRLLFAETS
jgi:predicted  nucleic acid-binding Zn-ribbon protein